MTVTSTTLSKSVTAASVVAGSPINFPGNAFATSDFEIYYNGDQLAAETTDYTVVLASDFTSADITPTAAFVSKLNGTDDVLIRRNVPLTQPTNLPPNSKFPETALERFFDKVTVWLQQHEDKFARSLLSSAGQTNKNLTLPASEDGKFLYWKADGSLANLDPSEYAPTTIADGSITTAKLANGSVDNGKIANGSVGTAKLVDDSITTQKVIDDQITEPKIEQGLRGLFDVWREGIGISMGQFTHISDTECKLVQANGRLVSFPDGSVLTIPSAGVSFSNSGLSGDTIYYAYVYNDNGTLTAELSTTAHATDSGAGIEIKSGDSTRVLVGKVYVNAAGNFKDNPAERLVASWHNRKRRQLRRAFKAARSTTSGSYTEIHTEIRLHFLSWGDAVTVSYAGGAFSSDGNSWYSGVSLDGSTDVDKFAAVRIQENSSNTLSNAAVTGHFEPSSGFHFVTILGAVAGGATATWETSSQQGRLFGEILL